MKVLITGGLGYIGSHTVVELLNKDFQVVVIDNLYNSSEAIVEKIKTITKKDFDFYNVDATIENDVEIIFQKHTFDAVIHFAGYKAVGESVFKPIMYYENNLMSTICISKLCVKYGVEKFIFSSSASVYGENESPLVESLELKQTISPYAETKVMCERILKDIANINKDFNVMLLRYFNPVGAHKSGLIGEKPNGIPNNLIPCIIDVVNGKRQKLLVYGDDYNTTDGTGVRDYIHVVDLAEGHVCALNSDAKGVGVYNLGTGCGYSVLEVISTFRRVNNVDFEYEIVDRRKGDLDSCFAACKKAEIELGFKAKHTLEDMCRDAFNFNIKQQ